MSDQKQQNPQAQPSQQLNKPSQQQNQNMVPTGNPGTQQPTQQQVQVTQQQQQPQQQPQQPALQPPQHVQQAPTPVPMPQQIPISQAQMAPQVVQQPPPVATPGAIPIAANPQSLQSQGMMANPGALTNIRSSIPQVSLSQMPGVQVIQQPIHSPPYIQPFYNTSQLQMLQQVQAMQVGNMNPQMGLAVQGRPPSVGPKSPNMMPAPATSQVMSQVQMKPPANSASSPTPNNGAKNNSNSKPSTPAPTLQQNQMMGNKQILQRPQSAQPVVIGQVGMIPNQIGSSQQMMVSQPKSPIVSIAPSSQQPMLNGTQQLRFTTQPTFVTNNGQQFITGAQPAIVGNQVIGQLQAMALAHPNLSNMPTIPQQQIIGSQAQAIIGNQPVYIRTAVPQNQIPGQQGIVGTVQPAQPVQQTPIATIQPPQQQQAVQPQLQPIQQQPIKSKPEPAQTGSATVSAIKSPPQIQAKPSTTAPTQKVVGQAQKVVSSAKPIAPVNKPANKGTTQSMNQKQPLQKQVGNQKNAATSSAHPGYQSMAHVYPSPATSPAKQMAGRAPRGRPPKTTTTSVLVNGTPSVNTTQSKPATSQANQPPPLLVPLPSKTQNDAKNEENKGPAPPTLEPVTTKNEPLAKKSCRETPSSKKVSTTKSDDSTPSKETDTDKPIATTITTGTEKQKAIVKPQILTHMIEGFVIQEGSEPFPVQRSSLINDFMTSQAIQGQGQNGLQPETRERESSKEQDEKESKEEMEEEDIRTEEEMDDDEADDEQAPSPNQESLTSAAAETPSLLKCEFCGKMDRESKFRRSKRFCSVTCSKRYNVSCRMSGFRSRSPGSQRHQKQKIRKRPYPATNSPGWARTNIKLSASKTSPGQSSLHHPEGPTLEDDQSKSSTEETTATSQEDSSEPQSPEQALNEDSEMLPDVPRNPPQQWTVQDVVDFIKSMPDCIMFADSFRQQEIDGQALMLLKEDHLMSAMNMKLGPALKICEKIRKLKGEIP